MKIIQLTSENVKRIKAVQIAPDGAIVQISGRNGQGKSSLLDSIAMVLGGKDEACSQPVRAGEKKAKIIARLDEDGLIVTRTFTASGLTTLTVTNADGLKYSSPQAVLDKLVGRLSFDPLAFSRMPPKQQADTLRQLVGLDFTDMDAERKAFFVDRTIVNAKVKQLESQKAGIPIHPGVPSKEISVEDLIAESNRRKKVNDDNAQARRNLEELKRSLDQLQQSIAACSTTESSLADGLKSDLATIEKNRKERIAQVNAECDRNVEVCKQRSSDALSRTQMEKKRFGDGLAECKNQYAAVSIATGKLVDLNVDEITDQIASAGTTNRRIRDHHQREELSKQAKAAEKESEALTAKIEAIDAKKSELLYSAPFPVQGLAFTDSGVTYNEIPFSQSSSAEQLRVSVAMGLAMNPKLRVMLIRDGSLLDDEGMKMLAKFAEENNAQIWIERVADKGGVGVVIEDGQIEASLATVATPKE